MIEIYYTTGKIDSPESLTFKQMQEIVGGMVECVHIREDGHSVQVICNEDGHMLNLAPNPHVWPRLVNKVNLGPGAVGNYIFLSGDDLLK